MKKDESILRKHKDDYWGSIAVLEMCRLAAEYHREENGVSLDYLPEALDLVIRNLNYFGCKVFPVIRQFDSKGETE